MSENRKFEILRKLAQESRRHPELLLKTRRGYVIYAAFELIPYDNNILVVESNNRVKRFTSMKSALRYCTALKYHDYVAAQHIQQLDQQLARAQTDIDLHMMRIQNSSNVGLHQAKLGPATALRENAKIHLNKYPIIAKYLQTKRITSNEINRSSS